MGRFCGDKDSKKILEAAEHMREHGFISDKSIFTEKKLWKFENFQSLERYFVDRPDAGEGTFFEKLSVQLDPTDAEVKQLASELLWVMFLCPSNIGVSKKKEGILSIWSLSEEPFPKDTKWILDEVLNGVGSAGTGFNTNRWRELTFFIRIMKSFKKQEHSKRSALLNDAWEFAGWLEQIPECNSRQFRHMILFLLFPDNFERIFGGSHRRKIMSAFAGRTTSQIKRMTALEIDRKLASIRKKYEQENETKEIDFYTTPLRELWFESKSNTWLLSWNPSKWSWETFEQDRAATHRGETITRRWSCANRNTSVGDKVYLVRTGAEPKGIIATGTIVTASYQDAHWQNNMASEGKTQWCVDVSFTLIQDPLSEDPYLGAEDLNKIVVDQQVWFPQSSGIEIKQRSATILRKQWENITAPVRRVVANTLLPGSSEATNLILYGPPGTGKTYHLNSMVEQYSNKERKIGRNPWIIQKLLDVRWFDVIFAALYDLGKEAKAKDIVNHEYIKLKARAMDRQRNISNTVWATLQSHTIEGSTTVQYKNKSAPFIFDKRDNGMWIFAGNWKEECAEQVELSEIIKVGPEEESTQQRYEFVTFHQAYSYEDFVEGIRPVLDEETGNLIYTVVPGVFQRIALRAKTEPDKRYAIFIDEINRGNIAKIFGELITLIEADKRAVYSDEGKKESGMELTLPYSGKKFGVPKNLDLYGTMNTADRSIALLDTALRRRFQFKELMPNSRLISGSQGDGQIEDGEGDYIDLRKLLDAINKRLLFLRNRDMTIGHAYFYNIRDFNGLKNVLLKQIIPLLQEYFYDDWQRIQLVFRDVEPGGGKVDDQIICHHALVEEEVLGIDHGDYEDLIEYSVAEYDSINPNSIRKIYEEVD
jgi:5-methylcytosine-specific restriction protein B